MLHQYKGEFIHLVMHVHRDCSLLIRVSIKIKNKKQHIICVGNPRLLHSHAMNHVQRMQIYPRLFKCIIVDKQVLKTIWTTQKTWIQRIKPHTFDTDIPESIPINVDNSKVIMDLVNTMIFYPMSLSCVQALIWQRSQGWSLRFSLHSEGENNKTWNYPLKGYL